MGLWLETTGCDHLHGGEAAMLEALCGHLARNGIAARAAVADTPGAAHALARHAATSQTVAMGDPASLLAPLPVACLRLPPETLAALHRVGLERVGQIIALPRAPPGPTLRDRSRPRPRSGAGTPVREPIAPLLPPVAFAHRMAFLEPLLTAESLKTVIAQLAGPVCAALERDGQGARTLDLLFQGVDGAWQAIRIGAAPPNAIGRASDPAADRAPAGHRSRTGGGSDATGRHSDRAARLCPDKQRVDGGGRRGSRNWSTGWWPGSARMRCIARRR